MFGGGGISPDYFVAADTNRMSHVIAKIYTKGLINDYGYKYYLANQAMLKQYKTSLDFSHSFNGGEQTWQFFENMAAADSIDLKMLNEREKAYLSRILKSSIARQLWRNEGYFEVSNSDDNAVKKALELLHK